MFTINIIIHTYIVRCTPKEFNFTNDRAIFNIIIFLVRQDRSSIKCKNINKIPLYFHSITTLPISFKVTNIICGPHSLTRFVNIKTRK